MLTESLPNTYRFRKRTTGTQKYEEVPTPELVDQIALQVYTESISSEVILVSNPSEMSKQHRLDALLEIVAYARSMLGLENQNISIAAEVNVLEDIAKKNKSLN